MTNSFCPQCKKAQEIWEFFDGVNEVVRCHVCGYQLATDAVMAPVSPVITTAPAVPAPPFVTAALARQPKLLFIDDDKLVLGLLRDVALAHGFLSVIATDGPSGITLAKQEQPDLIVLDLAMPWLGGFEVCRKIRAEPDLKHTPILILTALDDPSLPAQGMKVGATLTMTKTFDPQQLLKTIKTLLTLKTPRPATS